MEMEWIQNFLTFPELPDIVAYVLYAVVAISMIFVKAYVKKDNRNTTLNVDLKLENLNSLRKEFEEKNKELQLKLDNFEKEKKSLQVENKKLKKAILESSGNTRELVAKGTANKIAIDLNDKNPKEDNEGE